jgi:transposase
LPFPLIRPYTSYGKVAIIWLSYVLSESDHRKSHVKDWVERHQISLSACIGCEFDLNNFSDDRLTRLIYKCTIDENWHSFETDLAKETIGFISLEIMLDKYFTPFADKIIKGTFKLDSTSFTGYHEASEDGMMRLGFSNSNPQKLPQIKIMNCTDGAVGCPLVSTVSSGNNNDESMYIPTLERMRNSFNTEGYLYCGDSKISTKSVLDSMALNNEFYLCPLQFSNKKDRTSRITWIEDALNGSKEIIKMFDNEEYYGHGYETEREQISKNGNFKWKERVLIIKSEIFSESEKKQLEKKIKNVSESLEKLKTNLFENLDEANREINKEVKKIIKNSNLSEELFEISFAFEETNKIYKRSKRNGEYKVNNFRSYVKKVCVKDELLNLLVERLGWRVYITNISSDCLGFSEAYCYYRNTQYVIESGHHIFKSKPIGISPLYVFRDDQLKGLVRFLNLGVWFLKLLSLEITIRLKEEKQVLVGLTAGQPSRKASHPTAKSILSYFCRCNISLCIFEVNGIKTFQIDNLSSLCFKILNLLNLTDIYVNLKNSFLFQSG